MGLDGVLGAVRVGLDGLRGVGLNGLRLALLEAFLETDVVLLVLLKLGVVLLALLACGCIVLVSQLSAVLFFKPGGKVERVDRRRGSRAYDARRFVSAHRDLTDRAIPIPSTRLNLQTLRDTQGIEGHGVMGIVRQVLSVVIMMLLVESTAVHPRPPKATSYDEAR